MGVCLFLSLFASVPLRFSLQPSCHLAVFPPLSSFSLVSLLPLSRRSPLPRSATPPLPADPLSSPLGATLPSSQHILAPPVAKRFLSSSPGGPGVRPSGSLLASSRTCSPSCWPSRQPRAQQCRPSRCVLRRTRCRCGLPLPPFCNHLAAAHFPRHSRSQVVGLGLWKVPRETTADAVVDAIKAGYRHFDCACDYGNEAEARLRPVALCSSSSRTQPAGGWHAGGSRATPRDRRGAGHEGAAVGAFSPHALPPPLAPLRECLQSE